MDTMQIILLAAIPLVILQVGLAIAAILSIVKKPGPRDKKIIWICIALLIGTIGPIVYFAMGANALEVEDEDLDAY